MATRKSSAPAPLVNEVRNQVVQLFAKGLILGAVSLLGIAALGWWFYLQPKIQRLTGGVPPGMVAAFDLAGTCPPGWVEFSDAAGRAIIGTGKGEGLSRRKYRDTGGEERKTLTIQELPPHTHAANVSTGGYSFEHHKWNDRLPGERWKQETGSTGDGKPFDIMPPFIALTFCKKQ